MQDKNSVRIKSGNDQYKHVGTVNHQIATSASSLHFVGGNLKRSKSLSATDAMKLLDIDGSRINSSTIFTEYDKFSPDVQALIAQAVKGYLHIYIYILYITDCLTYFLSLR